MVINEIELFNENSFFSSPYEIQGKMTDINFQNNMMKNTISMIKQQDFSSINNFMPGTTPIERTLNNNNHEGVSQADF